MYRNALTVCVLALVALYMSGCASQSSPVAPSLPRPETSLQIPEGEAELYVFNDSGRTLIPSNQVVTDNGKQIASLPRQTYVRIFIAPGSHVLRPEPFLWKQEVKLNVQPGDTRYIVIGYKPERSWASPLAGPPLLMKQLTDEESRPLLREMKHQ